MESCSFFLYYVISGVGVFNNFFNHNHKSFLSSYMCMCVCVCVCIYPVCLERKENEREEKASFSLETDIFAIMRDVHKYIYLQYFLNSSDIRNIKKKGLD